MMYIYTMYISHRKIKGPLRLLILNFLYIFILGEKTPIKYSASGRSLRLLRVLHRPYSVNIGTNVTARSENSLLLKCPVSNSKEMKYFWMKDDVRFYKSQRGINRNLHLLKLKKSDSGSYTCVSDDPAKVVFGSVHLKVLGKVFPCKLFLLLLFS